MLIHINIAQEEIERRRALCEAWSRFANERVVVWAFADAPFYYRAACIEIEEIYGFTISGGHDIHDMQKLNAIQATVLNQEA